MGRVFIALAAVTLAAACVSTFDPDSVALQDDRDDVGGSPDVDGDEEVQDGTCVEAEPCEFGPPGVVAECIDGICTSVSCEDGLGDCNDDIVTDGCETALDTIDACGGCLTKCEEGNAQWACAAGACAIAECDNGWRDADESPDNGCELAVPPRPVVEAIDVRNHGIHVTWSAEETEAEISGWIVAWGPEPDNMGRSRRVSDGSLRAATVGPIAAEGPVFVTVAAVSPGSPETVGERSEPFEYAFVQAGWFNHSVGRFWTDGIFKEGHGGLVSAYGHVAHVGAARGGTPIPSRLARPRQLISVHLQTEGPQAGRGVAASFEGYVGVTDDFGVTWTEHKVPQTGNPGDGFGLFGARLLPTGRIVTCGAHVSVSDDMGESFAVVAPPEPVDTIYFGIDTLSDGDAHYVFCQGYALDDATELLVAWTGDGGDTWTFTRPNVSDGFSFDIAGGIHMLSPTEGFMGAVGGLWRTEDQWNTAQLVTLEVPGDDRFSIFRIVIDAAGNGIAAGVNAPWIFTTSDRGETWALDRTLPELPGDDPFFAGVVSLEGTSDDPFLILSTEGSVFRWDGPAADREFVPQARGFIGDLVGVSMYEDEVVVIAANQAILRGTSADDLRPDGLVAERAEPLHAMAASRGAELMVAVGDAGQVHTSRDNGRNWESSGLRELAGLKFVDVDVDDRGSMGFAVADGGPNVGMAAVQLLGNPPQIQIVPFGEINPGLQPQDLVPTAVDVSNDGRLVVISASFITREEEYLFVGRGGDSRVWTTTVFPTRATVFDVGLIRASTDFYAVGTAGLFVRFTDGEPVMVDLPLPAGVDRSDLEFVKVTFPHDRLNGWAYTANGWVYATQDGGVTWAFDRAVAGLDGEGSDGDYPHQLGRIWIDGDNHHATIVGTHGTVVTTANGGVPNPPIE